MVAGLEPLLSICRATAWCRNAKIELSRRPRGMGLLGVYLDSFGKGAPECFARITDTPWAGEPTVAGQRACTADSRVHPRKNPERSCPAKIPSNVQPRSARRESSLRDQRHALGAPIYRTSGAISCVSVMGASSGPGRLLSGVWHPVFSRAPFPSAFLLRLSQVSFWARKPPPIWCSSDPSGLHRAGPRYLRLG